MSTTGLSRRAFLAGTSAAVVAARAARGQDSEGDTPAMAEENVINIPANYYQQKTGGSSGGSAMRSSRLARTHPPTSGSSAWSVTLTRPEPQTRSWPRPKKPHALGALT